MPGTESAVTQELVLGNSSLRVAFDPSVGRITFFGRPSKANRLWHPAAGTALPPGGAKILAVPQVFWPQLREDSRPDPALDGDAWNILHADTTRILLQSPEVSSVGARVTWDLSLPPNSRTLTSHYKLERIRSSNFPLHLWLIARVPAQDVFIISSGGNPHIIQNALRTPELDRFYTHTNNAVIFQNGFPNQPSKTGTFGSWIAQIRHNEALVITTEAMQSESPYIENSNLQLFAAPDRVPFAEMEWTTALRSLQVGEALVTKSIWTIVDLAATEENIPSAIDNAVKALSNT